VLLVVDELVEVELDVLVDVLDVLEDVELELEVVVANWSRSLFHVAVEPLVAV
jgi:hypothetical protein